MSDVAFPQPGWATTHASYVMGVVRSVVSGVRDGGPFDALRVQTLIKRAGHGADVGKASPFFDEDDGASRILNFMVDDIDVLRCDNGMYSVDPNVRSAHSIACNLDIEVASAADLTAKHDESVRFSQLRRWIVSSPFKTVWRNGIRQHEIEEIIAMADFIQAIGYIGPPIIEDQDGITIDGHLRKAALSKLGIDPAKHTQTVTFTSDFHRLAWVVAAAYNDGKWSSAVRKEIEKVVNAPLRGSGAKMVWPDELAIVVGLQQEIVVPASTLPPPPPLPLPPPPPPSLTSQSAKPSGPPSTKGPFHRPSLRGSDGMKLSYYRPGSETGNDGYRGRLIGQLVELSKNGQWMDRVELAGGSKKLDYQLRRQMWFRFDARGNGYPQAFLFIPDSLHRNQWKNARVRQLSQEESRRLMKAFDPNDPASDAKLFETYEVLVQESWRNFVW